MKEISEKEFYKIMRRWVKYMRDVSEATGKAFDPNRNPAQREWERHYILGAISALVDVDVESQELVAALPPIVIMAWQAGRAVSTLGNWDDDAPDQRLRNASITWSERVSRFPRGGDEQWV